MLNFIAEIKTLRVRMTFGKKKKKGTYSDNLACMNMQKKMELYFCQQPVFTGYKTHILVVLMSSSTLPSW